MVKHLFVINLLSVLKCFCMKGTHSLRARHEVMVVAEMRDLWIITKECNEYIHSVHFNLSVCNCAQMIAAIMATLNVVVVLLLMIVYDNINMDIIIYM